MFYDRKVKYLDYCENSVRVKGCGVVKVQIRDKSLSMEVMVSGLPFMEAFIGGVLICTSGRDEYEVGKIGLENGRGDFHFRCDDLERLQGVNSYEDWAGIRIALGENREIRGIWNSDKEELVHRAEIEPKAEITHKPEMPQKAEMVQKTEMPQRIEVVQKPEKPQSIETLPKIEMSQKIETIQKTETLAKTEIEQNIETKAKLDTKLKEQGEMPTNMVKKADAKPSQEKILMRTLAEDKWEQLWNIYPHIRPFRDKREYLSITPADFVIFTAESYKAVNNSFLLHGFYNYHHLILTRVERKGEMICYVGVPGNYFEREKQVAIMFGFESFECEEEPAQAGDFGYYMMRAQL